MRIRIRNTFFTLLAIAGIPFLSGCTPSGPKALLQGEALLQKGQTREAVKKMERAVKYMPNNARAWNYLGVALHQDGKLGEALRAYQKAFALAPTFNTLKYNLGSLYLDQRNYQIAIQSFSNYLNSNQGDSRAWEKIGYAFLAVKEKNLAAVSFSNVVKIRPNDAKTFNTLGLIASSDNQIPQALSLFNQSAQCDSDYAAPHLNAAVLLQRAGGEQNIQAAIQNYNQFLNLAPKAKEAEEVRAQIAALDSFAHPAKQEPKAQTAVAAAASKDAKPVQPPAQAQAKTEEAAPTVATNAPVVSKDALAQNTPSTQPAAPVTPAPETVVSNTATVSVTELGPRNPAPKKEAPVATVVTPPAPVTVTNDVPEEVDVTAAVEDQPALTTVKEEPPAVAPAVESQEPPEVSLVPVTEPEEPAVQEEAVTPEPAPTARVIKIAPKETTGGTSESAQSTSEEKEKGNFFTRMFGNKKRSDDSEQATSERKPVPAAPSEPPTISIVPVEAAGGETTSSQSSLAMPVEIHVYEPYVYQNPPVPAAGNRDEAYPLFQRAYRAHQERDLPTAIEFYSKAIQKDPSWFEAHFNLGLAYYGAGEYSSSLLAYENALAIKPDSWETRYSFAQALNKAEHPNEAVFELKKVTQANDSYAKAWLELGIIYQNKFSDIPNAYHAYQKFITLAPEHPSAYAAKVWLSQNSERVKKN